MAPFALSRRALVAALTLVLGFGAAASAEAAKPKVRRQRTEGKRPSGEAALRAAKRATEAKEKEQASATPPPTRGPTRIDFDDRLIQGQTNRSGAVYLYDRKELKNPSMVRKRESFREEIVSSIYDS
jgi:hypothetical protein